MAHFKMIYNIAMEHGPLQDDLPIENGGVQ